MTELTTTEGAEMGAGTELAVQPQTTGPVEVFTFGEPESVLDRSEVYQYFEIWHNGRWYEPPLPMGRLAQAFNVSPHHRSAVALKVNMLLAQHIETRYLSGEEFERTALDFVQMGNGYLEGVPNMAGRVAGLRHAPSLHMRRGLDPNQFYFVNAPMGHEHAFAPNSVWHLQQPDVAQEVYGLPEWLSGLQSALLSENATLFRRRYYLNGAHTGYIMYVNEQLADTKTTDAITSRMSQARGRGNFKNMFINIPGGKEKAIQIIPLSEVTAKDEFSNVKNVSRDDLLAAHRTPPQLIGVIPQNSAGFGKVGETRDDYYEAEIIPIIRRMLRANAFFGVEVMAFRDYLRADGWTVKPDGTRVPPPRA